MSDAESKWMEAVEWEKCAWIGWEARSRELEDGGRGNPNEATTKEEREDKRRVLKRKLENAKEMAENKARYLESVKVRCNRREEGRRRRKGEEEKVAEMGVEMKKMKIWDKNVENKFLNVD